MTKYGHAGGYISGGTPGAGGPGGGVTSVDGDTGPAVNLPAFQGATAGTAGVKGVVPPPAAGEQDYYLKGDGTWAPFEVSGGDSTIVNSAANGVVDTHTPTVPTTYEWTVSVFDSVTQAFRSSKVLAIYNGTSVVHTVYQNVGIGTISRTISVNLNAGDIELDVANTGPNPLKIVVGRFSIIEQL